MPVSSEKLSQLYKLCVLYGTAALGCTLECGGVSRRFCLEHVYFVPLILLAYLCIFLAPKERKYLAGGVNPRKESKYKFSSPEDGINKGGLLAGRL